MNEKIPRILAYMQSCPFLDQFVADDIEIRSSKYDPALMLNVLPNGTPLYLTRTKKMPTTCGTPGHTLPSGYTPSGKYKPSKYVPYKTDKRAGK